MAHERVTVDVLARAPISNVGRYPEPDEVEEARGKVEVVRRTRREIVSDGRESVLSKTVVYEVLATLMYDEAARLMASLAQATAAAAASVHEDFSRRRVRPD